ncbi:glycosyltransferase family 39 protein [Laribacter hongkongensis]|uniref:ArnT family glycosyltransferase n=1 Tax=Laribacter hongkongensis TaxID=168471 RepID=UPI001EFDA2B2|nr:glycosyltransferase family 39 protein [Laribacter hongkongensis]MCG9107762.1 glycosyltransferase family 39 protein [Laribacter hongkongensis]
MNTTENKWYKYMTWTMLWLMVLRLIAMWFIPLNETTEARYGEIARKMVETGDWITLYHDYGVPFWAKPPLSTWSSAFFMELFGVNGFWARFPSLLFAIGTVLLTGFLVKKREGNNAAIATMAILASSAMFWIGSATVMTDSALTFSITLSMVSGWNLFSTESRKTAWAILFYTGLGLGMLAKGPLAPVLIGGAFLPLIISSSHCRSKIQRILNPFGIIVFLLIFIPWYWISELKTPGFLEYFLIGEHFYRFTKPGWSGDKYGFAHAVPIGMINVYLIIGTFPWAFVLLSKINKIKQFISPDWNKNKDWLVFLISWIIVPLAFFSLSRNVIAPYILPVMPAFAILTWEMLGKSTGAKLVGVWVLVQTSIVTITLSSGAFFMDKIDSSYKLIATLQENKTQPAKSYYLSDKRLYSFEFYSNGKAHQLKDIAQINCKESVYLSLPESDLDKLNQKCGHSVKYTDLTKNKNKAWVLVQLPSGELQ